VCSLRSRKPLHHLLAQLGRPQFIPEHQFLVDIEDILPARNIYGPLRLVHGLVKIHVA
jgi:hypothetical protein